LFENEIEKFLDQISLHDEVDLEQLFTTFSIQFKDSRDYFDEMYTVFANITHSYMNGNEQSQQIRETVNASENIALKFKIDKLITRYRSDKTYFYADVQALLSEMKSTER
jgi:hypothetical protein